jgi:hypothetical protein
MALPSSNEMVASQTCVPVGDSPKEVHGVLARKGFLFVFLKANLEKRGSGPPVQGVLDNLPSSFPLSFALQAYSPLQDFVFISLGEIF